MAGAQFADDEWVRLWAYLEEHPRIDVAQEAPTRRFLEAVLWMARAGAAWRLMPDEVCPWNSVDKRFARGFGQEKGIWQMLMNRLSADGDLEWLMLDSTVVRARLRCRRKKKGEGAVSWTLTGRVLQQAARSRRQPRQPATLRHDHRPGG